MDTLSYVLTMKCYLIRDYENTQQHKESQKIEQVSHKSIHMYYDFYEFQEQATLIYDDRTIVVWGGIN